MKRFLLLGLAFACRVALADDVVSIAELDQPCDVEERAPIERTDHYHYHPTGPDAPEIERNADSLSLSVPRHARRGLTATMSLRYRRVEGRPIVRVQMSRGLDVENAIPPAVRGPDGELLWFGLPGPMGNVKIKARVAADVPAGTALPIRADLFTSNGESEQQTETLVVR